MDQKELDQRLVAVVPHERQIAFQQTEFYAFVHFTVNTFTDREWGDGEESPEIFFPEKLDATQWVRAVVSAGMKGLILTCKHHDGFCLWPSKYTKHTVEYSPFRRDVVKEVSEACKAYGVKFGVYLSPWDRNCKLYGTGKEYDDYFVSQLTELLSNYGEIFSVWFDGACGEGPNGKKQYYDWDRYYQVIRELQPRACINVCGPDVRWCGNEAGHTREAEWSVVPARTRDTEKIMENSQQKDDAEFRQRKISAWDADLGSREILEKEADLVWYPAEVNTSIRPGWFWHESEDAKVRPLEELIRIYYNSVGGNATFLLNIPPTKEGLFHENDVKRLAQMGEYLRDAFGQNLLNEASVTAEQDVNDLEGITKEQDAKALVGVTKEQDIKALMCTDDYDTFYQPQAGETKAEILLKWNKPLTIRHIVLKENIRMSQRVECFEVEALTKEGYQKIYEGTVIGYKRILPFAGGIHTDAIRIVIKDSRMEPAIAFLGVYA